MRRRGIVFNIIMGEEKNELNPLSDAAIGLDFSFYEVVKRVLNPFFLDEGKYPHAIVLI
jgi:hypothetical protein